MTITAVFGIEEETTATLAYTEAVDVCAMAGLNTMAATIAVTEAVDVMDLGGVAAVGLAAIATTESPDICGIFGNVVLYAVIATTEARDTSVIHAIAPTSIIGHGKRFKIHSHDPKSIVIPQS